MAVMESYVERPPLPGQLGIAEEAGRKAAATRRREREEAEGRREG
jgi:hypothetical protein